MTPDHDPHAGLGTPREPHRDADLCSHCGTPIADEHMPLVLWADGGRRMWMYCAPCEQILLAKLAVLKWP
jgi:hypothetical protein